MELHTLYLEMLNMSANIFIYNDIYRRGGQSIVIVSLACCEMITQQTCNSRIQRVLSDLECVELGFANFTMI